jgi:hypothetical protein
MSNFHHGLLESVAAGRIKARAIRWIDFFLCSNHPRFVPVIVLLHCHYRGEVRASFPIATRSESVRWKSLWE